MCRRYAGGSGAAVSSTLNRKRGGYGGKLYVKCEPIGAALSWKLRRPVKLALSVGESFKTITRHPARICVKSGVTRAGRLLARDCEVQLSAIQAPHSPYASLLDVFERALEQEQEVSHQIDSLYETAFTEKAFAAVAELQWFLTEQVEEEKSAREIVAKFRLIGEDPASLLDLDRDLGSRTGAD